MTTNLHTAIPVGAAANAATVNNPLGELDAALTTVQTTANTAAANATTALSTANSAATTAGNAAASAEAAATNAAVVVANVQTVVDAASLNGVAMTQANGAAAAGQKVVTVDASSIFKAGAVAEYPLVGGPLESNTVATVDSATQITLTNNIGTGGIADNAPLTVVPAGMAGMRRGRVYALDFGLPMDSTTDARAALNAAWAACADGAELILPPGNFAVTDTVDWRNKDHVTVNGGGAHIIAKTGANLTGKALVNLAGSQYSHLDGLIIDCALAVNRPAVGLVLGRWDAGDGAANYLTNVWVHGSYTVASVYDVGAELTTFQHCRFASDTAAPCYYTSNVDSQSFTNVTPASNTCKRFYSCTFTNYGATTTNMVELNGLTWEPTFRDCYWAMSPPASHAIALTGAGASVFGLVIDNCRFEGENHADARMLYIANDTAGTAWKLENFYWTITSDYVIECATTSFNHSYVNALYHYDANVKLIKATAGLNYNVLIGRGNAMIDIPGGAVASANRLIWFSTGSPWTGAGTIDAWTKQDNIVDRLTDYDSETSVAQRLMHGTYVDSGATPNLGSSDLVDLVYGAPTTITNFLQSNPGRRVTLVANTGNATIEHNANIALAGAANWTMPAGATLTLVYSSHLSKWLEVARMSPS